MLELDRNSLLLHYKAAEYHVHSNPPFILCINIASTELLVLYRQQQVHSAAFITAWNPCSRQLSPHENQLRQTELQQALKAMSIPWFLGIGSDADKTWQEESVLALGIDKKNARELGERFQQNAIVWCGADAIPTLLLLPHFTSGKFLP